MIRSLHWTLMLALALGLHLLFFALFAMGQQEGAKAPGEMGIEIDLGMLGEMGAAQASVEAAPPVEAVSEPDPEPIKAPVPEPVATPTPTPTTKPAPAPEPVPAPVPPKQTPELQVKARAEAAPKPVPEVKQPVLKQEPPRTVEPQSQPVTTDATVADPPPSDQPARTRHAQRKATTGSSNADTTGGNPGARQSYSAQLLAKLARYKRYPARSRRHGEEGVVELHFVVDRSGRVLEYRISGSSGFERLDRATLKMLESAMPLPPFPADLTPARITFSVPVGFRLKDQG